MATNLPVRAAGFCPNCERETYHRPIHFHTYRVGSCEDVPYHWFHVLAVCEHCDQTLLYNLSTFASELEEEGDAACFTALWCQNRLWPWKPGLGRHVPQQIREVYDRGLRTRKTNPEYYAIQVRKALEAICADKGFSGLSLRACLAGLAKQGLLSGPYRELAHELLPAINSSAHHGTGFDPNLVPWVDQAFRTIADHLYAARWLLSNREQGKVICDDAELGGSELNEAWEHEKAHWAAEESEDDNSANDDLYDEEEWMEGLSE